MSYNEALLNKRTKFNLLSYNLQNEIFEFLDITEILHTIRFLDRKIYSMFKNKKIFYHLLINIKRFLEDIDFEEEKLNLIKSELSNFEENENILNRISVFLLGKKFQNEKKIEINQKNKINFKILFYFLENKKNLNELKLTENNEINENDLEYLINGLSKLSNFQTFKLSKI